MRLLHISDWHVGLTTGAHSRRPDHARVFAETVALARERKPDLILHTGDVFHIGYPAVDDMRFGLEALQELAAIAPVVVIRGNHDGDRLFRVFSVLLGPASRLTFVDAPPRIDPGFDPILRYKCADDSVLALAALPFVHANRFFQQYGDSATQTITFADRLGKYERGLGTRLLGGFDAAHEVAVFAAHQFVHGAQKSGSERVIHVGEEYATRAGDVPAVSYAAFGHIHRPQAIPGSVIARYAGSPIQIDFGEEDERKSVVFVEASPRRSPRIETIALSGGRQLHTVRVALDRLTTVAERCAGALCRVTVSTQTPTPDLARRVADALQGCDIVEVIEDCSATRISAIEEEDNASAEPSLAGLFDEYLAQRPLRDAEASRVRAAFATVLGAAEAHERPSFEELNNLEKEGAA